MSNATQLGRLTRVDDLRSVWRSESGDFTPWLAQEGNIGILGEAIGIELEVEAQEKSVGPFSADILCKDINTDAWVLIENQLERTDHKHLGQLLTYAAGLRTVTIVWIAESFTEEHRAALDWLNEITEDRFNFFGLEVELWKIGNSEVAPKFNVIAKPNNWSQTVSSAARSMETTELSERYVLLREYWTQLGKFLESRKSTLRPQTPSPKSWSDFALGRSNVHLRAVVRMQKKHLNVHVVIKGPWRDSYLQQLEKHKVEIETEIGAALEWRYLPDNKENQIKLGCDDFDPADQSSWEQQHEWMKQTLEAFTKAFSNRVRSLATEE